MSIYIDGEDSIDDSQDSKESEISNANKDCSFPEPRMVQHSLDKSDNNETYKGIYERGHEE